MCLTCNKEICDDKFVEKSYPDWAHKALVKLFWQNVQKYKLGRQSHLWSMWINLSWMQRQIQKKMRMTTNSCWEGRLYQEEGFGEKGNNERKLKKHVK